MTSFLILFPVARLATLSAEPASPSGPGSSHAIPCETDAQGKAVSFNPDNPYTCTIVITSNSDGSEDVRIEQPVVDRSAFEYKSIVFSPSDLVTISADGCIQTAGSGKTWKRYINPNGPSSGPPSGLYFGTIKIKGATTPGGLLEEGTPLFNLTTPGAGHPVQIFIPAMDVFPGDAHIDLTLGYIDDNYTDHGGNGYWGHDNGDNDQCSNTNANAPTGQFGGAAFVDLHVVHNASNPFGSVAPKQWDLVPDGLDPNGLAENPQWGWQVTGGLIGKVGTFDPGCLPACSSQSPSFDQAELKAGNLINHIFANVCDFDTGPSGHRNWFDVDYEGHVFWVEHSGGAFGDDDYNMRLMTDPAQNPAGTTEINIEASDEIDIGMEFDSDETIDNFDQSPFWKSFHSLVDNGDDSKTGAVINGHDAVVIGLMGFDQMHGAHTEIHPVHALAIREGSDGKVNPAHDRWFFFVRNWGDEGECSHLQHNLMDTQITLRIPPPVLSGSHPPHFVKASLVSTAAFGSGENIEFFSNPEGAFLTFTLPDASAQGLDFGEFELGWQVTGASKIEPATPHLVNAALVRRFPRTPVAVSGAAAEKPTQEEPEDRLNKIWSETTPAQKALYTQLLEGIHPARERAAKPALKTKILNSPPKRPAHVPRLAEVEATAKMERDTARFYAWCAATGGKLPTQPTWCADFPSLTVLTKDGSSPGKVSLTTYDAGGSGVETTEYSFDGKTWMKYSSPFALPTGMSNVLYRSTDKKGKVEEVKRQAF